MNEKIPTKLLKMKVLAQVPMSEYVDGPKCSDPLDEKKRSSFLQKLRLGQGKEGNSKVAAAGKAPLKEMTFNAAMWLRLFEVEGQFVSFFLVYRDDSGEFAVLIDEARVDGEAPSVMLTNNVSLTVRGEVQYIKACCAGLREGQRYFVDELYVQKVQTEQEQANLKRRA
ncbi:MAG: hypothetical protein MI864_02380 [Pseudomonadales bacterium]|nr:hypothetical protein [Pseudomonadales bacterium]